MGIMNTILGRQPEPETTTTGEENNEKAPEFETIELDRTQDFTADIKLYDIKVKYNDGETIIYRDVDYKTYDNIIKIWEVEPFLRESMAHKYVNNVRGYMPVMGYKENNKTGIPYRSIKEWTVLDEEEVRFTETYEYTETMKVVE